MRRAARWPFKSILKNIANYGKTSRTYGFPGRVVMKSESRVVPRLECVADHPRPLSCKKLNAATINGKFALTIIVLGVKLTIRPTPLMCNRSDFTRRTSRTRFNLSDTKQRSGNRGDYTRVIDRATCPTSDMSTRPSGLTD